MKIALVGPELEENLALRYLHAATLQAGHEALICDFHAADQIPDIVQQVLAYQPDAVGLSMVFTARAQEYIHLAQALRDAGWQGHLTAGGHFACFHATTLLQDVPALDSVLHGEGEHAVPDLLAHLTTLDQVAGLTYRRHGRIHTTPPRPPINNLDDLAFPTRPAHFHRYFDLPIANILSGRGCFANCDFCSINAWHKQIGGPRFRQRSVENLVREMAALYHDRGVRMFNFHDDNFFLPRADHNEARFNALHDALQKRGVGRIGIQVKARPDTVEPRAMAALKRLGLFRVFLGVESNAVAGLRALGRGITREQNHKALELLQGLGLHVTFNLLMFEPECTLDDVRQNVAFIRTQSAVPLNFCRTEVYSGTALEKRLRAAGRLEGDYFGYGYTMTDPQSQRAYEIFRHVFVPRNFALDGMNLQAMTLDYYFHVLRHFYPRTATPALHRRVRDFIRALNANNAALLERICAFVAQTPNATAPEVMHFAQALAQERIAYDQAAAPCCQTMLRQMRAAADAAPRWPHVGTVSRAAAAVAVLVTVLGCDSHVYEMAPAPSSQHASGKDGQPPSPQAQTDSLTFAMVATPSTEMAPPPPRPRDVAPMEMAPRPIPQTKPATKPATTTATQPKAPALPKADAEAVGKAIATAPYSQPLLDLATRHDMADRTVSVYLELNAKGAVTKCDIQLPPDEQPEFQTALKEKILAWTFPALKTAGSCTVGLKFRPAATKPTIPTETDTHPNEIAPLPHPAEMAPHPHPFEMAPNPRQ